MTQVLPWAQKISLAVQDAIYKVADDLTTIVDEALEAFEDAAEALEDKVTPVYHYTMNVNGDVTANSVVEAIKRETERQSAKHSPSKTGGREITNPTLEETLSVVYDYLVDNYPESRLAHKDKARALEGSTSLIAREFKTHIYKRILGVSYKASTENDAL